MNNHPKEGTSMIGVYGRSGGSSILSFDGSQSRESSDDTKQGHQSLVEWLNEMLPYLNLPWEASEEELRACLMDGTVLCSLLNQLSPGSMRMGGSFEPACVIIERFLTAMDEMALPRFEVSDLEQGDMGPVLQSLKSLKASFSDGGYDKNTLCARRRWSLPEDHSKDADNNFIDGFQFKEGSEINISHAKILELLKSNSLHNTSTRSLFDMLDKLLDESVQKMNGNVSHAMASILRGIVQVVEHRVSNQAENTKNQNILFRVREEKYRSRIKVLETLAAGTTEENEIVSNSMEHIKLEKARVEERGRSEEKDVMRLKKEKERFDAELCRLKQEFEMAKETHEKQCLELKSKAQKAKVELEKQLKEAELHEVDSSKKVKELEKKEYVYKSFINRQSEALQELKATSMSLKHEVLKSEKSYFQDLNYYGIKLRGVADAANNYHVIVEENRRLYNEVQELKGNIRVYCRIRPFLPGQNKKQTTIEYTNENGELVIGNPLKQGKDTHRLFKFSKVFGSTATQEEVFLDTRPLIRSILDGYNVCIFAYGQTGSGKTYTMSGPSITSREDWGVNYRALNDLFHLTQSRENTVAYEVGVQMVEIYNEQVRDILSEGGPSRRLGIWNSSLPNGLAVPDASMHCVRSTEDVLELMNIGLRNRTVGATALNERSSRSHCVLSVHVRGVDVETESILRGSLHLVDLAGSERIDRSEVTGDRLKEAQHINKSLSALGDVIFALAHKNPHVPYRNSKLTQVLQSSLGGQAKTLMFVQINPDEDSYAESVSTLKFAERVSGVELGAAKNYKEGRDVRQLMQQVSNLKDTIAKKDEELLKFQATIVPKRGLRFEPTSPRRHSMGPSPIAQRRRQGSSLLRRTTTSDVDNISEYSGKDSDFGSQHSADARSHQNNFRPAGGGKDKNVPDDIELLGLEDAENEERLSDISDSCLSMGTEADGGSNSSNAVELNLFPETAKPLKTSKQPASLQQPEKSEKSPKLGKPELNDKTNNRPSKVLKHTLKPGQTRPSRLSISTTSSSSQALTSTKRQSVGFTTSVKPINRKR